MTDPKKPATEQLRVQSATDQEKGILIDCREQKKLVLRYLRLIMYKS